MKEQICIRYPPELTTLLGVSQTTLVIDVPDHMSGIDLARSGLKLTKGYELGSTDGDNIWFIPPSQVLWVKRL